MATGGQQHAEGSEGGEPADWVLDLMRSFQDKITAGLLEGVYQLEGAPLRCALDAQARACVSAFVALADIPADLDFPSFLRRMQTDGPSKVEVTEVGEDEYVWTELHRGECVCPYVRLHVAALNPKLCHCGETWVRLLVERHAGRRAEVSLVESVATGAANCVYRIRLRPR